MLEFPTLKLSQFPKYDAPGIADHKCLSSFASPALDWPLTFTAALQFPCALGSVVSCSTVPSELSFFLKIVPFHSPNCS